jgi:hypothetical protein
MDVIASDRLPSCTSGEGSPAPASPGEAGAGLAMTNPNFFRTLLDCFLFHSEGHIRLELGKGDRARQTF